MRMGDRITSYTLRCIREGPSHPGDRLWLLLLLTASWIYRAMVGLRSMSYSQGWVPRRKLPVPVISVGNISLGGTGKTPVVEVVARALSPGKRIAILARGYKGSFSGETLIVSGGTSLHARPAEAGDEAFLLAKNLPMVSVLVDKDRFRAGSLAISQLNSQVLILDDGFQHLPLKRDLDIVLVDAAEPFGHGHLFPRGLLREPLKALARADLVLIVAARGNDQERLEEIKKTLAEYNPRAPIFMGERRPLFWVELPAGTRRELEEMKEKRCAAFCGIANPSSFLSLLSALGVEVVKSSSFPDHHSYSRTELSDIAGWAQQAKAQALLTTEKDAVRLPADSFPISMPLLYLRIEIRLQGEEEFFSRLHQGCGR